MINVDTHSHLFMAPNVITSPACIAIPLQKSSVNALAFPRQSSIIHSTEKSSKWVISCIWCKIAILYRTHIRSHSPAFDEYGCNAYMAFLQSLVSVSTALPALSF